jgi:hypothetical protein
MKDCWFGLLRSYLRVDDVIVRIYDTRFFCDYSTNYILREFTVIISILLSRPKNLIIKIFKKRDLTSHLVGLLVKDSLSLSRIISMLSLLKDIKFIINLDIFIYNYIFIKLNTFIQCKNLFYKIILINGNQ